MQKWMILSTSSEKRQRLLGNALKVQKKENHDKTRAWGRKSHKKVRATQGQKKGAIHSIGIYVRSFLGGG